jgi:hypothetical protein
MPDTATGIHNSHDQPSASAKKSHGLAVVRLSRGRLDCLPMRPATDA